MDEATAERARQGRKFGPAVEDYERGRPGYPAAAVEIVAAGLGLGPAATAVDLGAGTGKLTRLLADRFSQVVAVEPLAPMRHALAGNLPRIEVRDGTAERLPLADASVDAVFVAEAFHWFDAPAALAEAARVLRPGGGIVLLWNVQTGPIEPPLPEALRERYRAAIARGGEPGGPRRERGEWRQAFPGSAFGDLQHDQTAHEVVRDRAGMIANAMSVSSIAGLPAAERAALRADLERLVRSGHYRQPLRTDIYWARLTGPGWCDHCGDRLAGDPHQACVVARELEPPRFCPRCRRRLKVQVLPDGWTASCVVHGEQRSR